MIAHYVLAAIAAFASQDQTQVFTTDTTISVTVSRSARVEADRAIMYLVVEGLGDTPAGAVARLGQRVAVVMDTMQHWKGKIVIGRTIPHSVVFNVPQGGYPSTTPTTSYSARSLIRVSTVNLADLGGFQAAAVTAGASSFTGITYEASQTDSLWRAKIGEAAAAARNTAATLASEMGKSLGSLISMNATGNPTYFNMPNQISIDNRYSGNQSFAPELPVSAVVTVRYRLHTRQ
jgi:uncharacterized protein YggE